MTLIPGLNAAETTAARAVDAAVQAGRIPEHRWETWAGRYLADPHGTQALLDALWHPPAEYRATVQPSRHTFAADREQTDPAAAYAQLYGPPPPTPADPATDQLYEALYPAPS